MSVSSLFLMLVFFPGVNAGILYETIKALNGASSPQKDLFMLLANRIGAEPLNLICSGADWEHGSDLRGLAVVHSPLPLTGAPADSRGVGGSGMLPGSLLIGSP